MKLAARLALALFFISTAPVFACTEPVSVCTKPSGDSLALISNGQPATVFVDESADSAVKLAARSFAEDLERVSGKAATKVSDIATAQGPLVIAGVVGESKVIDDLVRAGKIDVADLPGQWEAFRQIVVEQPFPNVPRALVIAGADRRGVVFGLYDISEKMLAHARQRHHAPRVALRRRCHQVVGDEACARLHQRKVDAVAIHVGDQVVGVVDRLLGVVALVELGIAKQQVQGHRAAAAPAPHAHPGRVHPGPASHGANRCGVIIHVDDADLLVDDLAKRAAPGRRCTAVID